jgi:hypothetical protein
MVEPEEYGHANQGKMQGDLAGQVFEVDRSLALALVQDLINHLGEKEAMANISPGLKEIWEVSKK